MLTLLKDRLSLTTKNKLRQYLPSFLFQKKSYSQCGEDLLIDFALNIIHGSRRRTYLDIGANHPFHLSNTSMFYMAGGSGILVEPDPYFAALLRKQRPRDKVLQYGVHFEGLPKADLYIMDTPTLNTFSQTEMERYVEMGHRVVNTLSVELKDINTILSTFGMLDFMNLDVEGMDQSILEMVDWQKYRPTCICVETLTYDIRNEPRKLVEIIEFMKAQNYFLYADTYINSIFIDQRQWDMRLAQQTTPTS